MDKQAWKPSSPSPSCSPPRPASAFSFGRVSKPGSASTKPSSGRAKPWRNEEGAFLVFLGSVKLVLHSQSKVALQSRLDICAVKRATAREQLYRSIARSNFYLQGTVYGIYAARGLRLLPGANIFAAVGEQALLAANRAISAWQELQIVSTQAGELAGIRCAPTPFSKEPAFCTTSPGLRGVLRRKKPFFPDIKGVYASPLKKLGRVNCLASLKMRTALEIRGDPELWQTNYDDTYTH